MTEQNSHIRDLILQRGWLSEAQVDAAIAELTGGASLSDHLHARGLLLDEQVAQLQGQPFEAPTVRLDGLESTDVLDPGDTPVTSVERVGNYRILRRLGKGGMGEVYLAVQEGLDRKVALKLLAGALLDQPELQQRFEREAKALAKLHHPNITSVFDYGFAGGRSFIVMEYVAGSSLRERLVGHPYELSAAVGTVSKVLEALAYAHDLGVVHRDIKPANVMIADDGSVKVADFGLAKVVAEDPGAPELTLTDYAMGTPHYMAPEQVKSSKYIDHRADLYSVGVMLYEMLTGTKPLGRFEPPSQVSGVDPAIDPIVLRLLEADPEARYASAAAALEDLQRIQAQHDAAVDGVGAGRASRALRPVLVLVAVAVIALLAWLASTAFQGGNGKSRGQIDPIDWFERLLIGPDDVPAPYPWPPVQASPSALPRNPFLAKTESERSRLLTYLDSQGLKAVSAAEVRRAYHHRLGYTEPLPALTLLDFAREEDAVRVRSMVVIQEGGHRWAHREGRLLVFVARSPSRSVEQQRYAFEHIVNGIKRKLGRTEDDFDGLRRFYLDEDIKLQAFPDAGFGCSAYVAPMKYLLERKWRIDVDPDAIDRVYVAAFSVGSSEQGWMGLEYVVARAGDPAVRSALASGWRTLGGNPMEEAPFIGAVLVSRLRPVDESDVFVEAVGRAHGQLEGILAGHFERKTVAPTAPTLASLVLHRRELPDNSRFASEPAPPVTEDSLNLIRTWMTARALTLPALTADAVVASWRAHIVPNDVHILLIECDTPARATALADHLTRTPSVSGRAACRKRGSNVAIIVQDKKTVSGANTFYGLLGRLGFELRR